MLRNSLFLTVNSGVSAGLGFAFWIITARLFSTESVGLASSLTSASNLIVFLGLVGMNTTFVPLPMAKNRDRLITGVSLVTVGGVASSSGLRRLATTNFTAAFIRCTGYQPSASCFLTAGRDKSAYRFCLHRGRSRNTTCS